MQQSPLRTLVSRHVCSCRQAHSVVHPLSRSLASSTVRARNVPSNIAHIGSAEDLRRRYLPKPDEVDRDKIAFAELRKRNRRATIGIIACTVAMFGAVYFWPSETKLIRHDARPSSPIPRGLLEQGMEKREIETIETGTSSVPTFPKSIFMSELDSGNKAAAERGDQEYCLVGLGIHIDTLQERLIRTQDSVATTLVPGEKGKLRDALMSGDESEEIWNAVLKDGNIRSVFRIVPTRNTDFSHLKDGFLKQVTAKTQHFAGRRNDKSFSDESFGSSMNDFKALFNAAPRKQLPKGEILLLTRDAKGRLNAWYEDPKGVRTKFGQIEDERISRLVWLQYLSGKNPSSEGARKSIVDGVMEYVERPVGTVATQVV
ncbi:Altered inheritance of mitochondria protein 18 mitochondrial [Lithohypha guttulata]|nr:Altered inheritance of mitochondria protein 18 mitochondrial [Lithohypha guttulata]